MWVGVRSSGTGVTDSCELSCECWELNPGPPEEQPVLLTIELSLVLAYFLGMPVCIVQKYTYLMDSYCLQIRYLYTD